MPRYNDVRHTADQLCVRIMLDPKLTERQRDAKLKALANVCSDIAHGRIECPECGDKGEKQDNGASHRDELSYLCTKCGAQFDAETA